MESPEKKQSEKHKIRRSLAGKAHDEPDPAWRRFFMEVDNRRKVIRDQKKKPLIISSYEQDGQKKVIARQQTDPVAFKRFLKKKIVNKMGANLAGDLEWLRETWPQAVDTEVAAATEVYAFKNGVVTITVFSSVLLQEIRQFHQEAILQDLRDIWKASIPLVKVTYRIGKPR